MIEIRVTEFNYKIEKRGYNTVRTNNFGYTDGVVHTPWGFVDCYAQGDENHFHATHLRFICNGRMYHRSYYGKRYTPRGIKTKAMQFACEIYNEVSDG